MPIIHVLPSNVAAQIAAGEVVERPASVLKELIENCLDAQATTIKIHLLDGGITQIKVTDDGQGIEKDDLPTLFQRHATSKLQNIDDLMNLHSFGFRGEALYSIGAVASVTIESHTHSKAEAYSLVVVDGQKQDLKITGAPQGTTVTVSNLFATIPARKKFLKSIPTEFNACREIFIKESLTDCSKRFELWHQNKKIFQLPAQTFLERLSMLFGLESKDLLPIKLHHEYLDLDGFVSKPGVFRSKGLKHLLLVNHRPLESKLVQQAVKQGYGTLLPEGAYPMFFLNLTIRPDLIDINIHPRKEEIKFATTNMVFDLVRQAVSQKITSSDLIPTFKSEMITPSTEKTSTPLSFSRPVVEIPHYQPLTVPTVTTPTFQTPELDELFATTDFSPSAITAPVYQLALTYLLEIKPDEIVLYDQHALHERVQFERFTKQFLNTQKSTDKQNLLFPESIKLSPGEKDQLAAQKDLLQKIGFDLELTEIGVDITAIPLHLKNDHLSQRFLDFLDGLSSSEELNASTSLPMDNLTLRSLTFLSCRTAIKAGDKLSDSEMQQLLKEFNATKERYTCPHGRPVALKLGRDELDKLFMRLKKEI